MLDARVKLLWKHPVEVIKIMTRIIHEVEENYPELLKRNHAKKNNERFITDSICFNACRLAQRVSAKAIITMTHLGIHHKISSQRPQLFCFLQ